MAKYFINRRNGKNIETVDETTNHKDARYLVGEYQLSDRSADYYISQRPSKDW